MLHADGESIEFTASGSGPNVLFIPGVGFEPSVSHYAAIDTPVFLVRGALVNADH